MKKQFIAVIALVGLSVFSLPALSAEFVANQVKTLKDMQITSKVYMKGEKMRMEMKVPGSPMTTIMVVDRETHDSFMLMPQQKMYMAIPAGQQPDEMPGLEDLKKKYKFEQKDLGEETVNGYKCKKTHVKFEDKQKGEMTQWFSEELNFIVKLVATSSEHGEMTVELKDIEKKSVNDDLFQIPPGYKKMPAMGGLKGFGG